MGDTIEVRIPRMEECEFVIHADEDCMRVRGNALASGDDAEDMACENEIFRRLGEGDVWAWALVTVTCRYGNWSVVGHDHLSACSFRDEADFKESGYYEDMKRSSYEDFVRNLERMGKRIGVDVATVLMSQQFMEDMG